MDKNDVKIYSTPEGDSFTTTSTDAFDCHLFWTHLVDENSDPHPWHFKELVNAAKNIGYESYMFSEIVFYVVDATTGRPVDNEGYYPMPPEDKSNDFGHEPDKLRN